MNQVQFPVYFSKEEHKNFMEIAKNKRTSLNQLIRDLLYSYEENPTILNPTEPKTTLEKMIEILEQKSEERVQHNQDFERTVFQNFSILHQKVNSLMKKAKFSKKEIEELEGIDISGEMIFE